MSPYRPKQSFDEASGVPTSVDDARSIDDLLPEVYEALHALAARMGQRARQDLSVHPTLLVHEVYLRFARDRSPHWQGKPHLMAVAAKAMRQILADRARRRGALKRSGGLQQVTLHGIGRHDDPVDLLAVDAALAQLERLDPRRAEVVVLRAMGGLTIEETATALEVSVGTVKADWRVGKAWLAAQLRTEGQPTSADRQPTSGEG